MPDRSYLKTLIDTRNKQIQKSRKAWRERMRAIEQGRDEADEAQYQSAKRWYERFEAMESDIDEEIEEEIVQYPIYEHVSEVKGIGPSMAGQLAAFVKPEKAPYVSSLWKYSGYGLDFYWQDEEGEVVAPREGYQYVEVDGEENKVRKLVRPDPEPGWTLVEIPDRRITNWVSPYNSDLKVVVWKVVTQLMQARGAYYAEYLRADEKYARDHPEWTDLHKLRAAKRKVAKLFLSHYWERSRQLHGLSTPPPYAIEKLHHTKYIPPEDYGWPEMPEDFDPVYYEDYLEIPED